MRYTIEFKYLNDKNKYKSSVISNINKLKNIFNDQSDFKNLKNEIIKFLKEKKSIIVNIEDNNYNIEELNGENEEKPNNNNILTVIEELSKEEDNLESSESLLDEECNSITLPSFSIVENQSKSVDEVLEMPTEIIEYISVYSSDEEDLDNDRINKKKIDTQTYFIDSDSEDESIFSQKIYKNKLSKKILNNMNILELKNIMREKNLKLSEHGIPLKKQDMVKNILKIK